MWFIAGRGSGEVTHESVLVRLLASAGIDSGCCDRMGDEHPDTSSVLHSSMGHSSLWGCWHQDFVSETGRGHRAIVPRWEISQSLQTKARKGNNGADLPLQIGEHGVPALSKRHRLTSSRAGSWWKSCKDQPHQRCHKI